MRNNSVNNLLQYSLISSIYVLIIGFVIAVTPVGRRGTTTFYLIAITVTVLAAFLAQIKGIRRKDQPTNSFCWWTSFFVLFFILAFRNASGIDDPAYGRIFLSVVEVGPLSYFVQTTLEPGYLLLNYIISLFTHDLIVGQVICSFIPLFLFYKTFLKYADSCSLPFCVFLLATLFYFQMLSVSLVRMFIAMSIVFYAMSFVLEKKPKKYLLAILIATMFHYSALIMIIFAFFAFSTNFIKQHAKKFIVFMLAVIPLAFIFIAQVIIPLLGIRYSNYGEIGTFALTLSNFDTLPLLLLALMFRQKINEKNKAEYTFYLIVFTLSCLVSVYSSIVSLGRLIFYMNLALLIILPMLYKSVKTDFWKVIIATLIVSYGFAYLGHTQFFLDAHIPYLFPYRNVFFTI